LANGAGEVQVTHAEIQAWQANMGVELLPWEVSLIRRLSLAFVQQSAISRDPYCKPPYGDLYKSPDIDSKIDAALD